MNAERNKYTGAGAELLGAVGFQRVKVPQNPHLHQTKGEKPWAATHYHVTMMPNLRPSKGMTFYYSMGSAHTKPPTDKDLCLALCNIAQDGDWSIPFEEWAGEYGYDPDSRSAEKTYNLCIQQARDLAAVFPKPLEWWDAAREELDC